MSNLNQTPYCDHRHVPFVLLKAPTAPELLCHVHLCWNSCEALNYVLCTVTTNVMTLLQIPIHTVRPVVQYGFYTINKCCQRLFFRIFTLCRSQWPLGLRRGSAAARLLGLRVRVPPGVMDVSLLLLCVVRWKSLQGADHYSRGVLPSV